MVMKITLEEATGADGNTLTITSDPTEKLGEYTLEVKEMFVAGEQIKIGGETFEFVSNNVEATARTN